MMRNLRGWIRKVGPLNYLSRMATRQFVKRALHSDLTLTLANGRQLLLPRSSDYSSVAWVTRGAVDDGLEEIVRWFVRPNTVLFDVGAHFGFYSVLLSDLHARVVAFEPDPRTLPALKANLADIPEAVCVAEAVSSAVGAAFLLLSPSTPRSRLANSGQPDARGAFVNVKVTTLDSTWRRLGRLEVGTLKIDTEGHESEVLAGGQELIECCRPQMLIEATSNSLRSHRGWMDALGYRSVTVSERRRGQRQSATVMPSANTPDGWCEGMVLFLPPGTELSPAYRRLCAPTLAFS